MHSKDVTHPTRNRWPGIGNGRVLKMTKEEFYKAIAEQERKKREAIKAFVQGAISGDLEFFASSIALVDQSCLWPEAFRALAKQAAPIG
jgi:hypothetical protein